MIKQFFESMIYFSVLLGVLAILAYIIDLPGEKGIYQIMFSVLLGGLLGLVRLRQVRNEEIRSMIWLYPGDTIQVTHSAKIKHLRGEELTVTSFQFGSKDVYARLKNEKEQYIIDLNDIKIVSRNEELLHMTIKNNKPDLGIL